MFKNAYFDLDELKETVSTYIMFCEDLVIPRKTICIYPNNKLWVSKSVRTTIIQRICSFNEGNGALLRELQKQVKKELKLAKHNYKDKVVYMLSTGNCMGRGEVNDGNAV